MKQIDKPKTYMTPNEVAKMLMVSPVTIRQWAQKGSLDCESTLGGHRRFRVDDVERFAREHGLTLYAVDAQGLRILVVDDDRLVAESMGSMFLEMSDEIPIEVAHGKRNLLAAIRRAFGDKCPSHLLRAAC